MVDMNGLQKGAVGLVAVITTIVLGAVILDRMAAADTIAAIAADNSTTPALAVAQNGTQLITSILGDWGSIIVLGMIVIFVFVGILSALTFLAARGGQR